MSRQMHTCIAPSHGELVSMIFEKCFRFSLLYKKNAVI